MSEGGIALTPAAKTARYDVCWSRISTMVSGRSMSSISDGRDDTDNSRSSAESFVCVTRLYREPISEIPISAYYRPS
jgi:hypothetical protein